MIICYTVYSYTAEIINFWGAGYIIIYYSGAMIDN